MRACGHEVNKDKGSHVDDAVNEVTPVKGERPVVPHNRLPHDRLEDVRRRVRHLAEDHHVARGVLALHLEKALDAAPIHLIFNLVRCVDEESHAPYEEAAVVQAIEFRLCRRRHQLLEHVGHHDVCVEALEQIRIVRIVQAEIREEFLVPHLHSLPLLPLPPPAPHPVAVSHLDGHGLQEVRRLAPGQRHGPPKPRVVGLVVRQVMPEQEELPQARDLVLQVLLNVLVSVGGRAAPQDLMENGVGLLAVLHELVGPRVDEELSDHRHGLHLELVLLVVEVRETIEATIVFCDRAARLVHARHSGGVVKRRRDVDASHMEVG